MVAGAHQVHPKDEVDWTLHGGNEARDREIRNAMIKDLLTSGRGVQYRSGGNSLVPVVYSGDVTMWEPVTDHDALVVGEIVFCLVQPTQRYFGHAIHKIDYWNGTKYWEIGNMSEPPHINGYCYKEHIYGTLMEVSGIQPESES